MSRSDEGGVPRAFPERFPFIVCHPERSEGSAVPPGTAKDNTSPPHTPEKWFILSGMDHFEVLREKIGRLRAEIAQIQELNQHYRLHNRADTEAQIAHGQRQERLQAIQQELGRLAGLGRKVQSIEEVKEKHRASLHLVKKVS